MRIYNNVRGYSESRQRYSAGVRRLCCSIAVSVYGNILTAHSKRSIPLFGQFRTYTVFKNALSRFARALSRILLRISGRNSHHGRTQKARTYNTRRSRTPERRVKQRGTAFVIEVVGCAFWGSRAIGIKLYLIQMIASWILAVFILRSKAADSTAVSRKRSAIPELSNSAFVSFFGEAIVSGALGIIKICAYIVFFASLTEALRILPFEIPKAVEGALSAVLEFTSGCRMGAEIGGKSGIVLSSFAIGFSGISVLLQGASFASNAGFSLRKTAAVKLLQGTICAIAAFFLI